MTTGSAVSPYQLSPVLLQIADDVRKELAWRYDTESQVGLPSTTNEAIKAAALRVGFELSSFENDTILAFLESEWNPFGILQPLIDDPAVNDILVSSFSKVSVQQNRRNLQTSVAFPDQRAYEAFVERILSRAGTSCTTRQPIADCMIGQYIRVHAVHQSLCEDGPYLTIRVNRFSSVSVDGLIDRGMAPAPVFDYLRALIGIGRTILLVGEVGTGKTTVARALAATIPEDESILVIEDTPEIRLEHPHVRYVSTRTENLEGEGRISPAQCIRAGMRMAMNRIIFGEIRDAEAAEAFIDVCTSGHPGLSTLHSRAVSDALTRLELLLGRAQRGAERAILLGQIAAAVHAVVLVDLCPLTKRRRIMEVREIGPFADGMLRSRELFSYGLQDGTPVWRVSHRVSAHRELIEQEPWRFRFASLPEYMELPLEAIYRETSQYERRAA